MPSPRPAALLSLVLLLAGGATASAGRAPYEKQEETRTVLHGAVRQVVVDLDAGSVVLRRARSSVVDATSTWFMTKPSVTVSLRDGVLRVEGRCPDFWTGLGVHVGDPLHSCRTDLVVSLASLPRTVTAATGVGDVSVTGVRGPLSLSTVYGDVAARDVAGPVRVAADGDVDLMDVRADGLKVSSGTGDTRFTRVRSSRPVVSRATSGAVSAVALRAPQVQVSSDTGTLQLVDVRADRVTATTNGGSVFLNDSTVRIADVTSAAGTASVTAVTARSRLAVRTDSGKASLAQVRTPRLEVTTNDGDVAVTVPPGRYALVLRSDGGSITLDRVRSDPSAPRSIAVSTRRGDIALLGR